MHKPTVQNAYNNNNNLEFQTTYLASPPSESTYFQIKCVSKIKYCSKAPTIPGLTDRSPKSKSAWSSDCSQRSVLSQWALPCDLSAGYSRSVKTRGGGGRRMLLVLGCKRYAGHSHSSPPRATPPPPPCQTSRSGTHASLTWILSEVFIESLGMFLCLKWDAKLRKQSGLVNVVI